MNNRSHHSQPRKWLLAAISIGSAACLSAPAALAVTFSTPDGVAGAPRSQTGGGASRTSGQCLAGTTDTAVQALMPNFQRVLTVSARPTFFVSVPPTTAKTASFSLQDSNSELHYRTEVELPADGGIVQIPLPENADELAVGQDYTWYFEVHCVSGFDPNNPTIDGTIYRTPLEAEIGDRLEMANTAIERAEIYGEYGIWYDALASLAAARQSQPTDSTATSNWSELLSSVGLEQVAEQPLNP